MCYLCAMNVQHKRSYAKESTKSKPTGVRFDLEKVEFVKTKEKLNTYQKVVDFLLNKYWWEHKVAKPTHKEVPMFYDSPKIDKGIYNETSIWQEPKPKIDQYAAYQTEISEANSVLEIENIVREIKKDAIPDWQKNKLEKIAVEKSKTFDF
jgi:hypothetical protein